MLRKLILALSAAFLACAPAHAQTGSAKTPAALATETNAFFADNTSGGITPFNTRQTLLDIISSYMNFSLNLCSTSGAFPIYNAGWVCSTAGGAGSAATLNGGPFTIAPAQGTNQALNTLQVVTGTGSAPLNNFHISFDQSAFGSNFSEGWYYQHEFGGGATTGGRQGLTIQLSQNAATNAANTNRQYVAFAPFVTANSGDGGGSGTELGFYYAIGSFTWIKAAATHIVQAQAGEFDMLVESGASLLEKYGLKVVQVKADAVQGSSNDAAFVALTQAGGTAPGWKVLIQGGDGVSGQQPLASTGKVLGFKSAQTVDGGIDLATNVTCTTYCYKSNGFAVDGSGNVTAASGTIPTLNGTTTVAGLLRSTFGTPTIASGACGTGTNGTISGTNQSGVITIGAAATATCTISFSATLSNAPGACIPFPGNAAAAATGTTVARVGTPSTSSWVITGSALASTVYSYICF